MTRIMKKIIMLILFLSFYKASHTIHRSGFEQENAAMENAFYVDSLKLNKIPLYFQSTINQKAEYYGQIINEPFELRSITSTRFFPVDISFFIADAKYDEGKLKILEFGEGPRSRFNGYDTLYGRGKMWAYFWQYLEQFQIPIWYVDPNIDKNNVQKEVGFKEFKKINGIALKNMQELIENDAFQHTAHQDPPKNKYSIKDYKGIIIFRHKNASHDIIEEFKRNFPYFIVVDNASSLHVNNKYLTSLLFNDKQLTHYRPQCKSYLKQYSPSLATQIIKDFHCNTYVIKPLTAFKGNGVIIVKKETLNKVLYHILKKTKIIRRSKNPTYNHWARNKNKKFIVEECEASKYIKVGGKTYDPTMRMVFCLHYEKGKIYLTMLGGYWKLPPRALEEQGTLIEKSKSKIVPNRASSAKIAQNDMKNAQRLFQKVLPLVYLKMLESQRIKNIRNLPVEPIPYLRSMLTNK